MDPRFDKGKLKNKFILLIQLQYQAPTPSTPYPPFILEDS